MFDVGVKGINSQQVENFALDVFKCEQFGGGGHRNMYPLKLYLD